MTGGRITQRQFAQFATGGNSVSRHIASFTAVVMSVTASLLGLSSTASAAVLYGITGDGGSPSETMFTIDKATAVGTQFLTLGAGGDGEAIGFNPVDGRMYHASANVWESIDLSVPIVVTSLAIGVSAERFDLEPG